MEKRKKRRNQYCLTNSIFLHPAGFLKNVLPGSRDFGLQPPIVRVDGIRSKILIYRNMNVPVTGSHEFFE